MNNILISVTKPGNLHEKQEQAFDNKLYILKKESASDLNTPLIMNTVSSLKPLLCELQVMVLMADLTIWIKHCCCQIWDSFFISQKTTQIQHLTMHNKQNYQCFANCIGFAGVQLLIKMTLDINNNKKYYAILVWDSAKFGISTVSKLTVQLQMFFFLLLFFLHFSKLTLTF